MTDDIIRVAEAELSRVDPILGGIISVQRLEPRTPRSDHFASLARSIIGQQVSVAAASAIAGRLFDKTKMNPEKVLALTDEQLRGIGLSRQKSSYIRDLAERFSRSPDIYTHLNLRSDEEVITELTAVRGIGVWTAQMFLISTLGRPDVFAPDDAGLQRAMKVLYGWGDLPPKKELEAIASLWQPYRTVASLHLWLSLDNNPT